MLLHKSLMQKFPSLFCRQIGRDRRALVKNAFGHFFSDFGTSNDLRVFLLDCALVCVNVFKNRIELVIRDQKELLNALSALPALKKIHYGEHGSSRPGDGWPPPGFDDGCCCYQSSHGAIPNHTRGPRISMIVSDMGFPLTYSPSVSGSFCICFAMQVESTDRICRLSRNQPIAPHSMAHIP